MDGDFKGDFTRDTFVFDPFNPKHYSRVLMQQGRVQLDADWNEQTDLLLHYLRALAKDIIGPHGGPGNGFKIGQLQKDGKPIEINNFSIGEGHYYVDGILCENDGLVTYVSETGFTPQPDYIPLLPGEQLQKDGDGGPNLIYLDVWERQITSLEDDNIREVALGVTGPDTATRARVVWQVKVIRDTTFAELIKTILGEISDSEKKTQSVTDIEALTEKLKAMFQSANRGYLKAMAKEDAEVTPNACITPPDARFRGAENQLYRVEIHNGGTAWQPSAVKSVKERAAVGAEPTLQGATFVWDRNDGSFLFSFSGLTANSQDKIVTLTLDSLGRDESRFILEKDDWVEVIDEDKFQHGTPSPLLQVASVDPLTLEVTLRNEHEQGINFTPGQKGLLRLWSYRAGKPGQEGAIELASDGAAKVIENKWLTLEDGVQIMFQGDSAIYRTGDYWLIPARTVTGDVEWPQEMDQNNKLVPKALSPHGVEHHYALLAIVTLDNQDHVLSTNITDLRYTIQSLATLP
jgi:hypothetical protein